jgi:C1A family cysteine protease
MSGELPGAARRVAEVQARIVELKLRWKAGETSLSSLTRELRARRLGLEYRGPSARELASALPETPAAELSLPAQVDWRAKEGENWVTAIKDQGACGACVAFGSCAALESQLAIDAADASALADLSEAFLFCCGGGSCADGWEIPLALEFLTDPGVVDAACFPYHGTGVDQPCAGRCADWSSRLHRLKENAVLATQPAVLAWVATTGPVVGAMDVYEDFFHYTSGVYEPTSVALEGSHAIAVIGYDQGASAWICKNSWGAGWGEAGYFQIAFEACNMLTRYPMYGLRTK